MLENGPTIKRSRPLFNHIQSSGGGGGGGWHNVPPPTGLFLAALKRSDETFSHLV